MSLKFNDKVSAHVYATVNSANNDNIPGRVPLVSEALLTDGWI